MWSPQSQLFIKTINILKAQQPEQERLAENQPTAGLNSLNEYENGMRKSETELFAKILRTVGPPI